VAEDGRTRTVGAGEVRFPDASARGDLVYELARAGSPRDSSPRSRLAEASNIVSATGPTRIDLVIAPR